MATTHTARTIHYTRFRGRPAGAGCRERADPPRDLRRLCRVRRRREAASRRPGGCPCP